MGEKINIGANPSLKQLVYDDLRMRIISGELTPGTKLKEEDLASAMHISRAPMREALNMLERDGFVTIIPRRGAVVSDINEKDVYDIWAVRELLEPTAASLATPEIPADKLDQVEEALQEVLEDSSDFVRYMNSDLELHTLFYDYVPNHYLADVLRKMKDHSLRLRWNGEHRVSEQMGGKYIVTATREHLDIVDRMRKQDLPGVYDMVKYHIRESVARTLGEAHY